MTQTALATATKAVAAEDSCPPQPSHPTRRSRASELRHVYLFKITKAHASSAQAGENSAIVLIRLPN